MRKLLFAVVVSSSLALVSCGTPSPEKVCNHLIGLANKKKEMKEADKEKKIKRCVEKGTKEKEKDPERYKCVTTCFMDIKDIEDASGCEKKCKKKDKDDDDDKKKKDDDDDDDKDKDKDKKKKKDDD